MPDKDKIDESFDLAKIEAEAEKEYDEKHKNDIPFWEWRIAHPFPTHLIPQVFTMIGIAILAAAALQVVKIIFNLY